MDKRQREYLKKHPLCVVCMTNGFYRKASHVIWHIDGTGIALCDNCYRQRND